MLESHCLQLMLLCLLLFVVGILFIDTWGICTWQVLHVEPANLPCLQDLVTHRYQLIQAETSSHHNLFIFSLVSVSWQCNLKWTALLCIHQVLLHDSLPSLWPMYIHGKDLTAQKQLLMRPAQVSLLCLETLLRKQCWVVFLLFW